MFHNADFLFTIIAVRTTNFSTYSGSCLVLIIELTMQRDLHLTCRLSICLTYMPIRNSGYLVVQHSLLYNPDYQVVKHSSTRRPIDLTRIIKLSNSHPSTRNSDYQVVKLAVRHTWLGLSSCSTFCAYRGLKFTPLQAYTQLGLLRICQIFNPLNVTQIIELTDFHSSTCT